MFVLNPVWPHTYRVCMPTVSLGNGMTISLSRSTPPCPRPPPPPTPQTHLLFTSPPLECPPLSVPCCYPCRRSNKNSSCNHQLLLPPPAEEVCKLTVGPGTGMAISLSSRPGLRRAGSNTLGLLVAATMDRRPSMPAPWTPAYQHPCMWRYNCAQRPYSWKNVSSTTWNHCGVTRSRGTTQTPFD